MIYLPVNSKRLKKLVGKCKHFNVFPSFLPHLVYANNDHPITKLALPLIEEAEEYLTLLSQEERNALFEKLPSGIAMQIGDSSDVLEGRSFDRFALFVIVAEVQHQYLSFKQIIEQDASNSVVLQEYPELEEKFDKDGLLRIDDSFRLLDGGIEYKEHILHYHQFLRRNFTSQPNFDFLVGFIKYLYQTNAVNEFRIAIDHLRIMPKEYYSRIYEFDTWFGAPFDKNRLDDPNATGLTIIKRNKDSLFELDSKMDRTEFFWSCKDRIKTFQVEEISETAQSFGHYLFNRYVHSERDIVSKTLGHFDGAVKIYLVDQYGSRYESNMPNHVKSHKKVKLFRIDGNIAIQTWIDLMCGFFKGNEMIIQYLNPGAFKELFSERVRDFKSWKAKQTGQELAT